MRQEIIDNHDPAKCLKNNELDPLCCAPKRSQHCASGYKIGWSNQECYTDSAGEKSYDYFCTEKFAYEVYYDDDNAEEYAADVLAFVILVLIVLLLCIIICGGFYYTKALKTQADSGQQVEANLAQLKNENLALQLQNK